MRERKLAFLGLFREGGSALGRLAQRTRGREREGRAMKLVLGEAVRGWVLGSWIFGGSGDPDPPIPTR